MDRRKDQPASPALPAPTVADSGPTAEEVMSFLRAHPDFLNLHPALLTVLTPPGIDRGDRIVDMQRYMVQHQRAEIARLTSQHKAIVAAARANLVSQGRIHKAVLAIIAAASFEQLIQIVTGDLAMLLDADIATIAVERQGAQRVRLPHHGVQILEPGTVTKLLGPDRDVLLETDTTADPRLFGDAAELVRSAALVRLPVSAAAPAGMLCIGTRKPGRFHGGQGTELLSFLARALGITIAAWLDLRA